MEGSLEGKVALVAGATRGAGRGIAVELGAAGATVYVTGRTSGSQRSEMNRPETIEETAALVDEAGGHGIPVRVDHLVPDQVAGPGRPDPGRAGRASTCWSTTSGAHADGVGRHGVGVDPRHRAAHAPPGRRHPRHHQPLRRAAAHRAAGRAGGGGHRRHRRVQRGELPGVVLLRPGQGRGEPDGVRARPRAGAPRRHRRVAHPGLAAVGGHARGLPGDRGELAGRHARSSPTSPSPRRPAYVGRAVAALAADPDVARWNGQSLSSGGLAHRSTASPTSTAAGPTPGATSSRCRTRASRPTPPATAERGRATGYRRAGRGGDRGGPGSTRRSHRRRTLGAMAFPVPRSLSPSKVSSFTDCALAFRFSVIDRLPEPPTIATNRGHAGPCRARAAPPAGPGRAHAGRGPGLPRRRRRPSSAPTPSTLSLGLDDEAAAAFRAEAAVLVDNYFRLEDPTRVPAIGLELKVEAEIDGIRLRGIIDRLELDDDGELVVTDYKTGGAPTSQHERKRPRRRPHLLVALRAAARPPAPLGAAALPREPRRPRPPCPPTGRRGGLERTARRGVAGRRAGLRARGLPAPSRAGCATSAPTRPTARPTAATRTRPAGWASSRRGRRGRAGGPGGARRVAGPGRRRGGLTGARLPRR